ncbi:MAG: hypothetical protein ACR2I7_05335 [Geodermatophilaceae bacterium]
MNDALPIAKADLANQMQLLKTAMDEQAVRDQAISAGVDIAAAVDGYRAAKQGTIDFNNYSLASSLEMSRYPRPASRWSNLFPSQVSAWLPRGRSVVPDRGDRGSGEFGQLAWRSVDREIRALAVLEIAGVGRRVASCPENHVLDVRHQLANAQGQALLELGWAAPAGVRQR